MAELAPSLLAADFTNLGEQINILNEEKIKYLHLDVMDGHFVPNISYGPSIIKQIRPLTTMVFDVHLMIDEPERYIEDFADAGSDTIMFHVEATKHPHRLLQQIKDLGCKAGITLNPGTPLEVLEYLMEDLDQILLMSVNPGFGGQSFIPQILNKIKKCRELIDSSGHDILLEVDGGVKTKNVKSIVDAGCDLVVSGSDVFGPDIRNKIHQYYKLI
ncbi:MAG: ribulose-phosphate 3-epimerase [Tissierellia bacterium]|nr:ribulose-phosphate 3-epimerase [Tissierellia bacterium]